MGKQLPRRRKYYCNKGDGEQIAVVSGDETGISFVDPTLSRVHRPIHPFIF